MYSGSIQLDLNARQLGQKLCAFPITDINIMILTVWKIKKLNAKNVLINYLSMCLVMGLMMLNAYAIIHIENMIWKQENAKETTVNVLDLVPNLLVTVGKNIIHTKQKFIPKKKE